MKIERFRTPGLAQFAYILSSGGEAVAIDPVRNIERYLEYLKEHDLALRYVLETHIHADFAAGSSPLAEATGATLALSGYDEGEQYRYAMPHHELRDGAMLSFGSAAVQALHTPGHTPEHLSFVAFAERGAEPTALFSGDFLFVGGFGRPDLLGDTEKIELAHEVYRSAHVRIGMLADQLVLYPGHGAGSLCGFGIGHEEESTLGREKADNPLFLLPKAAFVEELLASVPPMPAYYPRIKQLNSAGASVSHELPGGASLSLSDVVRLPSETTILLDLRSPEAFAAGHIARAISLGAGANLSLWAGWLVDPEANIVLIGDSGDDVESRQALALVGLDKIAGFLDGGMSAWCDAGLTTTTFPLVTAEEVQSSRCLVIDVRSREEWKAGHIAGSRSIPLEELVAQTAHLARDLPLQVVCGSSYRASIAASLLLRLGFTAVTSMKEGMAAWERLKLPLAVA